MDSNFMPITNEKTVLMIGESACKFDKLNQRIKNYSHFA